MGSRVISYLLKEPKRKLLPEPGAEFVLRVKVTALPNTKWNANPMREKVDPSRPAQCGIMLLQSYHGDFGRLWSTARITLSPGIHNVTVPARPSEFVGVFGKTPNARQFNAMMRNPSRLGVAFGGQFYGHGVAVSAGRAEIEILALTLRVKR
jgi:hypothetical protein